MLEKTIKIPIFEYVTFHPIVKLLLNNDIPMYQSHTNSGI